jgi:hypothetical protein
MAPTLEESTLVTRTTQSKATQESSALQREPLKLSGVIEQFESFDVTPAIGREYPTVNLKEWLSASNSDELLRDLAITSKLLHYLQYHTNTSAVSQRGVVFFRKQDDLDNESQKELIHRLGLLAGKPATSGLHIHPVTNAGREYGGKDDEISVISSEQRKKLFKGRYATQQSLKGGWHSDITFEPIPSDYAVLRLTKLPKTGGGR